MLLLSIIIVVVYAFALLFLVSLFISKLKDILEATGIFGVIGSIIIVVKAIVWGTISLVDLAYNNFEWFFKF